MNLRLARSEREYILYAFLESMDLSRRNETYTRLNLIFDSVSAVSVDDNYARYRNYDDLFYIRIMTTFRRFREKLGIDLGECREGDWFKIHLHKKTGAPPAWVIESSDGDSKPIIRTNVVKVTKLNSTHEIDISIVNKLDELCNVISIETNNKFSFEHIPDTVYLRKVDVGQACCTAIHADKNSDSTILGYYDVGEPIGFNIKTFPITFPDGHRVPEKGFVLLSHWDHDHYSLALKRCIALRKLQWFAPKQKVGPNAAKFQHDLGDSLNYISAPKLTVSPNIDYIRGNGILTDRNSSGYYLKVKSGNNVSLLSGDVDYKYISTSDLSDINSLAISHHGGKNKGAAPLCCSNNGLAVISYGKGNKYKHPDTATVNIHIASGWTVQYTAEDSVNHISRGDKWLY